MNSLYFTGGDRAPAGLEIDSTGARRYTLPLSLSAGADEDQARACSLLLAEMRKHLDVLELQQWLLSLANVWEQNFPQWKQLALSFEEDASYNLLPFVRAFCDEGTVFWEPGRIEMAEEGSSQQAPWAKGWASFFSQELDAFPQSDFARSRFNSVARNMPLDPQGMRNLIPMLLSPVQQASMEQHALEIATPAAPLRASSGPRL